MPWKSCMHRASFQTLLATFVGLTFGACFNFEAYNFEAAPETAVAPEQPLGGAGGSTSSPPSLSGSGGGSGGASACPEDPSRCLPPTVDRGERGAACQSGIDCRSGFCTDGVCCEEA